MKRLSKSAKKQILNIAFLLVLIGITLAVLLTNYKELNFRNIGEYVKGSNKWLLGGAFGLMFVYIMFEAASFYIIARRMGHKIKYGSSFAYASADIYYSAITPFASGGQPASAYYMVKDGMAPGSATFVQVFNLVAYTVSLVVLSVFALIIRPRLFVAMGVWPKVFIVAGLIIQTFLALFFVGCIFCYKAVLKVGNGFISLLTKLHIVKKPDKWRKRFADEVGKYSACIDVIKKHKMLFTQVLLCDIGQRTSRVVMSCLVCLAYTPTIDFWDVFALQTFVILGYTSIPLPGGVGIFEYLYTNLYGLIYADIAIVMSAMMIMRTLSYYLNMIFTATVTLGYHVHVMRRKPVEAPAEMSDGGQVPITLRTENIEETAEQPEENGGERAAEETVNAAPAEEDTKNE